MKRNRNIGSRKNQLIRKSREAALAAVQIFNNPSICFKAEAYIVLMIIAWTYLLHAHFREQKIEHRYYEQKGKRRVFKKTKHGAYKFWELERCLSDDKSPIDRHTANNLRFLIGLRHEIEHQMTSRIDDSLGARFQACCLNYNDTIKRLFGDKYGIDIDFSFSLQFSAISKEQKEILDDHPDLPANIKGYISTFDSELSEDEYLNPRYAYRLIFVQKTANREGQADRAIEFVKSDSPLAKEINAEYALIKETEKNKLLPKQIVDLIKKEGYTNFSMHHHTQLWKKLNARSESNNYGVMVAGRSWYWYETWLGVVRDHCRKNKAKYVP